MGTYVVGAAALFAIGFITYEVYEGFKEAFANAEAAVKPVTDAYATGQQVYADNKAAVDEGALLTLASNPMTMPFVAAYEAYEAI